MKGSVSKRCKCPTIRNERGARLACKKDHGSWYYVVDLGTDGDGKRKQERRGGYKTKNDAETALADLITRLTTGEYVHDTGLLLGQWLDMWLADRAERNAIRPGTYTLYEGHIRKYWKPRLGNVRLRDLRVTHIHRALTAIGKGEGAPGPSTIHRIHSTLRSALSTAVKRQLIAFNPTNNVDLPTASAPKVKPWAAQELGAFLDHIAPLRLAPLFEVLAATGMRRGEVCGLRWEDIDLSTGLITVRQQITQNNVKGRPTPPCPYCGAVHKGLEFGPPKTKSGEDRSVEVDSATAGVLLAHRLRQDQERNDWGDAYVDHGLVFAKEDGNPIAPGRVYEIFQELAAQVRFPDDEHLPDDERRKLRPTRLHDLRHAAASLRLAAGVDIAIVSKALGHSTVRITEDTYSHLLPGVARNAAERANALIPRTRRDQHVITQPETDTVRDQGKDVPAGQSGAGDENRTRTVSLGKSEGSSQAVTSDD